MKILSVIVPCFNEEQALPFFYEEIKKISGLPNFNGESPNSNGEHLWGVSHRKN